MCGWRFMNRHTDRRGFEHIEFVCHFCFCLNGVRVYFIREERWGVFFKWNTILHSKQGVDALGMFHYKAGRGLFCVIQVKNEADIYTGLILAGQLGHFNCPVLGAHPSRVPCNSLQQYCCTVSLQVSYAFPMLQHVPAKLFLSGVFVKPNSIKPHLVAPFWSAHLSVGLAPTPSVSVWKH